MAKRSSTNKSKILILIIIAYAFYLNQLYSDKPSESSTITLSIHGIKPNTNNIQILTLTFSIF